MDAWKGGSAAIMAAALAACGGSGDDNSTGSGTSYAYVPPVLNSSRVYAETVVEMP